MPQRRFAVTGAQGVGKTTLARALFDRCSARTDVTCDLLQGIGQRVKDAGYPLGSAATSGTVYAFAAEHLRRERTCSADLVIQDRCLVDLLAYVSVLGLLDQAALSMLQEATLTSIAAIDLVFYVPMCEGLHTGVESPEFRAKIDAAIPLLARDLGIPIFTISGMPAEQTEKAFGLLVAAAPEITFKRDIP